MGGLVSFRSPVAARVDAAEELGRSDDGDAGGREELEVSCCRRRRLKVVAMPNVGVYAVQIHELAQRGQTLVGETARQH